MNKKIFKLLYISIAMITIMPSCKNNDTVKYFTATWYNYDGSLLKTENIKEGDIPNYNLVTPSKDEDDNYRYEFDKFIPDAEPIYKDSNFTATYRSIEKCIVSWYGEDIEQPIKTEKTDIESINYKGTVPSKTNQGDKYFYFNGWEQSESVDPSNVKQITCKAKFEECKQTDDRDYDGLADYLDPSPTSPTFNSSISCAFNGGEHKATIKNADFKLDFKKMFVEGDENTFNKDIAKLCAVFEGDNFSFNDEIKSKDTYNNIYERCMCDKIETRSTTENTYTCDLNDQCQVRLAHKLINIKDYSNEGEEDKRDFVFIRPIYHSTNEMISKEWLSNMDIGYNGEEYYSKEGNNHESAWLNNSNYYKGIYVAASRIKPLIDDFINENCKTGKQPILLISGHSRCASIANILGNMYNNDKNINSKNFVYCLAPLYTYFGDVDNANKNIFNIINSDDMVPNFPLNTWKDDNGKYPNRFGINKSVSIGSSLKNLYHNKTGNEYTYIADALSILKKHFGDLTRKDLYSTSTVETLKERSTKEEYIAILKDINPKVDEETITKYFIFNDSTSKLTVNTCLAGLLKISIGLLTYLGGSITDTNAAIELVNSYKSCALELVLNGLTKALPCILPHYTTTYYIVASGL